MWWWWRSGAWCVLRLVAATMASCPITAAVAFLVSCHLEEGEKGVEQERRPPPWILPRRCWPIWRRRWHGGNMSNWQRIYHLVVICAKLMLEVVAHLPDQTWESSLVLIETSMLRHRRRWHLLVSHTSLEASSWNQTSPSSSSPNQMTAVYWMLSPCWMRHLGVFSREGWACRAMSMSMLMVQSTYAGSDPISYHGQRWCFQWSDMAIGNSLFRRCGWAVDAVIIWSFILGLANALMLLKSTIGADRTQKIALEDLMMSWFEDFFSSHFLFMFNWLSVCACALLMHMFVYRCVIVHFW
jgi:hypothetical protein